MQRSPPCPTDVVSVPCHSPHRTAEAPTLVSKLALATPRLHAWRPEHTPRLLLPSPASMASPSLLCSANSGKGASRLASGPQQRRSRNQGASARTGLPSLAHLKGNQLEHHLSPERRESRRACARLRLCPVPAAGGARPALRQPPCSNTRCCICHLVCECPSFRTPPLPPQDGGPHFLTPKKLSLSREDPFGAGKG